MGTHTYAKLEVPQQTIDTIVSALRKAGKEYVDRYYCDGVLHMPDIELIPFKVSKPGNTYGKNEFREVNIQCDKCHKHESAMMQCDTGTHRWDCDECGQATDHTVTEVNPIL